MTKDQGWRLLFGSFLGAIIVFFVLSTMEPSVCRLAESIAGRQDQGLVWCSEFWFERYQTGLGVLVAVGAAWTSWHSIREQLLYTRRQVSADRYDTLVSRIDRLYELRVALRRIMEATERLPPERWREAATKRLGQFEMYSRTHTQFAALFDERVAQLREAIEAVEPLMGRGHVPLRLRDPIAKFWVSARSYCDEAEKALSVFHDFDKSVSDPIRFPAFNSRPLGIRTLVAQYKSTEATFDPAMAVLTKELFRLNKAAEAHEDDVT